MKENFPARHAKCQQMAKYLHTSFQFWVTEMETGIQKSKRRENLKYQCLRGYSVFCGADNLTYSLNQQDFLLVQFIVHK
jgi:hypothetical protein